jgi:hypothetical protein
VIAAEVTRCLASVLKPNDFDLTRDGGALDIATDTWSIHLEDDAGFFTAEDEPENPAEFAAARRKVMPEKVERALREADRALGGALSAALARSDDPFTNEFVAALRAGEATPKPE